jgi:galactan endo-1,6-beta-galactosidase
MMWKARDRGANLFELFSVSPLWSDTYPLDRRQSKGTLHGATNRYFVLAQYVRHIRPGMRIIDSGDQATVAAYDPKNHRLVLVTVRGETQQRITYDLSRFTTVGGAAGGIVRRWTTDANPVSVDRQYVAHSDVRLSGKGFSVDFEPRIIQTFEIDNVTL